MMMKIITKRRRSMKMNTKKTISAVLALIMSAAVLTTGCGKAEDNSADTSLVTSFTEFSAEETFISGDFTKAELEASKTWNETQINETMYTTQACYSRAVPQAGAETVSKYTKGTKVTVVAATDTGYYKLKDGSFIHSSFLSDIKPGTVTTTDEDYEEIFDDEEPAETTKKSSTTTKKASTTTKKSSTTTSNKTTTKKTTTATTKSSSSSSSSVTYNVDYKTKYVYKQLPSAEKKLYSNIVEAAKKFNSKVTVPDGLTINQVTKTYVNVINQEPQLFWLPRAIPANINGVMNIKYVYTEAEVAEIQPKLDKNVKTIMNAVNQYKSTVNKIKVIYDWVILNNNFSTSNSEDTCSIRNGLAKGADLQCAGYARTMQYLFDIAGIDSVVIIGKNPEGTTHAWNKVYCDNGYYNIDATWGDPMNKPSEDYIRYNYFLVPDSWIKNDHLNPNTFFKSNGSSIKLFDEPVCTKTGANYYRVFKKEFSSYKDAMAGMKAEIDSAVKAGRIAMTIRVTDKDIWDKMNSKDAFRELQNYAKSKSSKVKKLSQLTKNNDGILVIQYDITYN